MVIEVPGFKKLELKHLVLDYNGTLAVDGVLVPGVSQLLTELSAHISVHVLTADTFGKAGEALHGLPCELTVLPKENQDEAKKNYVKFLGPSHTIAMGNGRNDRLMLEEAEIGICVLLDEGASVETLVRANIVTKDIIHALSLFQHPLRLVATLRN